jgi:hypothetical protein
MFNEFGKKPKFTLVTVVAVATVMLVAATTEMAITGYAFAYNRNQAASAANDCGNGQVPTNIGCQNTDSQIQGDENSVAITSQQTFPPSPPEPAETATLIVKKVVECEGGQSCPELPTPQRFVVDINTAVDPDPEPIVNNPQLATGVPVTINPGEYETIELFIPVFPNVLVFIAVTMSEDCSSNVNGPILAGEERECTITNTYAPST